MANQGAKKRVEENRKRLQSLRYVLIAGIATYLGVRLLVFRGSATTWHFVGLALTLIAEWVCYSAIAAFADPVYDEKGELIDGGADLSMGGMCGYYHDLIYITVFVQVGASFSNWFWYMYLLVPGYGLYKLMEKVIIPYFSSAPSEPIMDDATRKKLEKAEKRAERRKYKWR